MLHGSIYNFNNFPDKIFKYNFQVCFYHKTKFIFINNLYFAIKLNFIILYIMKKHYALLFYCKYKNNR